MSLIRHLLITEITVNVFMTVTSRLFLLCFLVFSIFTGSRVSLFLIPLTLHLSNPCGKKQCCTRCTPNFFVDADCNHSARRMSSFVCSPDGMYVVDASKDVLDGGAGCWTSWVLTRGLADSVGPQITVIRVSNHSIISSCCYATQLHLFLVAVVFVTKVLKMVP